MPNENSDQYSITDIQAFDAKMRGDYWYEIESIPPVPVLIVAGAIWGGALGTPKNNDGDELPNLLACELATLLDEQVPKPQDPQVEFTRLLVSTARRYLIQPPHGFCRPFCHFEVDYGPCENLKLLCKNSTISASLFPWKSDIRFDRNNVSAKFGYRAPRVHYHPLADGRVLQQSEYGRIPPRLLEWLGAQPSLPDGMTVAELNWRKFAAECGIDLEVV